MKNLKYNDGLKYGITFLMTIILTSCSDFLDKSPISQVGVNNFYQTAQDFNQAVVATYSAMESATTGGNSYYMLLTDLRSDNGTSLTAGGGGGGAKSDIDLFEVTPENEHVRATYLRSYTAIKRANDVIANIESFDMDQTQKSQYIGEVKAIRAYMYFNLVRFFGGVPLVTEPFEDLDETYNVSRATVEQTYARIITDLNDAASSLPVSYSDSDAGRITEGAARSILGTVYLTNGDYADAAAEFQKVVNSGQYDLLPDYTKAFDGEDQNNVEAIWQILYKSGADGIGSNLARWYAPSNSDILENGRAFGFLLPTKDLQDDYEEGDIRRDASISNGYTNRDGEYKAEKYVRYYVEVPVDDRGRSDTDWNVVRYADVLLRYAEALNEQNNGPTTEAYEAINKVRQRAGLPGLRGMDYNTFKEAVYHEQRVESPFEGHRWFDLIRTGRALDVMNSKITESGDTASVGVINEIQAFQLLYPLPLEVVEVGRNIDQNPGY